MRNLLLASTAIAAVALTGPANATQLITFAQISGSNTVTATDAAGVTTIAASNTLVNVGQFLGGGAPLTASLSFTAHSIDTATTILGAVIQHFSGTFAITEGATNLLSGTFTDAAFGALGGPGLTVDVSVPGAGESIAFTSSVIPASELLPPATFDLAFSNVTPVLAVSGGSIASFTASVAGDASASAAVATPEPASLAVLGAALLGMAGLARRRRNG